MIFEQNNKFYRICDCCGNKKEIQKQTYLKNKNKKIHYCSSCVQIGSKNHRYGNEPWNKGLTKQTDNRIKTAAIKDSKTKSGTEPWNKGGTYDELKSKSWANTIKQKISKSKIGKPNYKRRKSNKRSKTATYFRHRCRAILYSEWTSKILKRDNYTCQLCGYKKELEVHHIRKFKDILFLVADKLNLKLDDYKEFTDKEFELFRNELIKEHKLDDGITLCKECHKGIDKDRSRFFSYGK